MSAPATCPRHELRPELPPLPERIRKLPVDRRGYPVPWFVAWVDGEPEFRAADGQKYRRALHEHLCWTCGERLGTHLSFVIGPMCAVNRISAEPPSHHDCAVFSAIACPFLSRPHMRRREGGLPAEASDAPGMAILRNPGVALVWTTRAMGLVRAPRPDGTDGVLVRFGRPSRVECFAEGRPATRDEVVASITGGLPLLAREIGGEVLGRLELRRGIRRALEDLAITLTDDEALAVAGAIA